MKIDLKILNNQFSILNTHLLFQVAFQFFHHQPAADKERCTLVKFGWLNIQYPDHAIRRFATGFFNDKGEGIAFV